MDKYLIISSHTEEDCDRAIEYILNYHTSYLTKFEWGCMDHDHNAYAIIDAENYEHAKMAVPPLFRDKTKAIKLVQFSGQTPPHPVS